MPGHRGDATLFLGVRVEPRQAVVLPGLGRVMFVSIRVDDEESNAKMHLALDASRSVILMQCVLVSADRQSVGRHIEAPLANGRRCVGFQRDDAQQNDAQQND